MTGPNGEQAGALVSRRGLQVTARLAAATSVACCIVPFTGDAARTDVRIVAPKAVRGRVETGG